MPRQDKAYQHQIVFLAGGAGKRLADLHPNTAKPLIPILGKPLISWQLDAFRNTGNHAYLFLLHHYAEDMIEYLEAQKRPGEMFSFIVEDQPLGTGGALLHALPQLEDSFLLVFADMIFTITRFMQMLNGGQFANKSVISLHLNDHMADSDLFSVEGGYATRNSLNDGAHHLNSMANAGVYYIHQSQLTKFNWTPKTKIDLEKDIIYAFAHSGALTAHHFSDYLRDLGTPERIERFIAEYEQGYFDRFAEPTFDPVAIDCKKYIRSQADPMSLFSDGLEPFKLVGCDVHKTADIHRAIEVAGIVPTWLEK